MRGISLNPAIVKRSERGLEHFQRRISGTDGHGCLGMKTALPVNFKHAGLQIKRVSNRNLPSSLPLRISGLWFLRMFPRNERHGRLTPSMAAGTPYPLAAGHWELHHPGDQGRLGPFSRRHVRQTPPAMHLLIIGASWGMTYSNAATPRARELLPGSLRAQPFSKAPISWAAKALRR